MNKFFTTIMILAFALLTTPTFADGYHGGRENGHQQYQHQYEPQRYHQEHQPYTRGGYWDTITEQVIIGWERVEYEDFYDWRMGPGNEFRYVKIRNGYTANVPIYGWVTRRVWVGR